MVGKTHVVGGVALALTVSTVTGLYLPSSIEEIGLFSAYLGLAGTGALIPDIDTKKSTVSQKYKLVSFFSRLFLTHRGFTHSLTCLGILGTILYIATRFIANPFGNIVFAGIMIGYLSHIILDSFNPMGVPVFYPCKFRLSIAKIKTRGFWEIFVFATLTLVVAYEGFIIAKGLGLDISFVTNLIKNI